MSNRQSNFQVGDEIVYLGMYGVITKIIPDKSKFKYVVEFEHGRETVPEGKLKRA